MSDNQTTPTRGRWHHRDERGGSPPEVSGAFVGSLCAFCGKAFVDEVAARQHEISRHKKLLAMLMEETNEPTFPDERILEAYRIHGVKRGAQSMKYYTGGKQRSMTVAGFKRALDRALAVNAEGGQR